MTKNPDLLAKRSRKLEVIANLFRAGKTLREIASLEGCTTQNISRCLKLYGVTTDEGGQAKTMRERKAKSLARRDAASIERHGCTYAQYAAIRDLPEKPIIAFCEHRSHARARGIGWELNLWQWWMIWQQSGKWDQRGPGQGFCMCREGDEGPYAVGNVFIATIRENSSRDYCKASGLPIGVYMDRGRIKATRSLHGKKYWLGAFATAELAHKAYLSIGSEA